MWVLQESSSEVTGAGGTGAGQNGFFLVPELKLALGFPLIVLDLPNLTSIYILQFKVKLLN